MPIAVGVATSASFQNIYPGGSPPDEDNLLLEDGSNLLLEDGFYFLLE